MCDKMHKIFPSVTDQEEADAHHKTVPEACRWRAILILGRPRLRGVQQLGELWQLHVQLPADLTLHTDSRSWHDILRCMLPIPQDIRCSSIRRCQMQLNI